MAAEMQRSKNKKINSWSLRGYSIKDCILQGAKYMITYSFSIGIIWAPFPLRNCLLAHWLCAALELILIRINTAIPDTT